MKKIMFWNSILPILILAFIMLNNINFTAIVHVIISILIFAFSISLVIINIYAISKQESDDNNE